MEDWKAALAALRLSRTANRAVLVKCPGRKPKWRVPMGLFCLKFRDFNTLKCLDMNDKRGTSQYFSI